MAIAVVDTGGKPGAGSGTSDTISVTLSSGCTMLILVFGGDEAANVSGVTWNGVSCTSAVAKTCTGAGMSIWYLANPSSGTHNVFYAHNNNRQWNFTYATFSGSATTIGANASDNGYTTSSCTVTTTGTGNGYCVDGVVNQANRSDLCTEGASQTRYAAFGGTDNSIESSYKSFTGGADTTMSWTGNTGGTAAHAAVEIDEALAANGNFLNFM